MAEREESPEAVAHPLVERIFELLQECRATLPTLELPRARSDDRGPGARRFDGLLRELR